MGTGQLGCDPARPDVPRSAVHLVDLNLGPLLGHMLVRSVQRACRSGSAGSALFQRGERGLRWIPANDDRREFAMGEDDRSPISAASSPACPT